MNHPRPIGGARLSRWVDEELADIADAADAARLEQYAERDPTFTDEFGAEDGFGNRRD